MSFIQLPRELQLMVLERCNSSTLIQAMKCDHDLRSLALHALNQKVSLLTGLASDTGKAQTVCDSDLWPGTQTQDRHTTSTEHHMESIVEEQTQNLFITVFSPQIAERTAACQLYETKCLSSAVSPTHSRADFTEDKQSQVDATQLIDILRTMEQERNKESESYYSTTKLQHSRDRALNREDHMMTSAFQLGSLRSQRDPLSDKEVAPRDSGSNELHVLVDEDSSAIKFRFEMSVLLSNGKTVSLLNRSEKILKEWSHGESVTHFLRSPGGEFCISFKLRRGDEVPPRSPYDYECITNYYVDFQSFCVNNCYLLQRYEKAMEL